MLRTGSLLIGQIRGNDTIVYWNLYGSSNYTAVDTFARSLAPNGDSLVTFRLSLQTVIFTVRCSTGSRGRGQMAVKYFLPTIG